MSPAITAAEIMDEAIEKQTYQVFVGSDSKTMNFLYRLSPKMAAQLIYKNVSSLLKD